MERARRTARWRGTDGAHGRPSLTRTPAMTPAWPGMMRITPLVGNSTPCDCALRVVLKKMKKATMASAIPRNSQVRNRRLTGRTSNTVPYCLLPRCSMDCWRNSACMGGLRLDAVALD